jgi:hydrogenase/urease accessory protein HupE
VRSPLLQQLPRGHRQYLSLRNERNQPLGEQVLDAAFDTFETRLDRAGGSLPDTRRSPAGFVMLGVEHILTGWDHLAFLLGLLIVGGGFREALKIITAFTVSHSLTLALATLNLIRIPASVVEPIIAASIIYVGIENVLRRDLKRRWWLAFGFGLIHGCGFASALRELGIGTHGTGVVLPLLSFNLGVEAGQIAIAVIVLPLIWKLRCGASVPRWVPACSLLIAVAGAYWLAERVFQ